MSTETLHDPLNHKTALPTLIWRAVMLALGAVSAVLASYFALLSDARNDQRYVQIERYNNDRARDREVSAILNGQINDRLRQQDKKLDEIAGDVKTLLRESRGVPR